VPGTVSERLYKRVARTLDSDESDGASVWTPDVFAPTLEKVAAVQAEVDDDALTKAIEPVKCTVRSSSRHRVHGKRCRPIRQWSWRWQQNQSSWE